ncbi:MAG TPA: ABC transporter substrate-binding protein [Kribbella sp.]
MALSKRTVAFAAATAALAVTMAACGGSSSSGGSAGSGGSTGTLTLGALFPPVTYAASGAEWANVSPYMQAVYDTLLHATPDAKVEPWLATSWTYNTNKTVLTMKLRTDVKFTDGEAFTAQVAAQNLKRFRDGTSPNKSFLTNVKDAKAVDPATLQLTLSQPDPSLLNYLTQNAGIQESPKAFTASDAKTKPVGSGPYILDTGKTVIGSKYVYTKNPGYWAKDQQHYSNLLINVYGNISTQVNALKGGQVSGLNLADNSANDQLKASGITLSPHELDWQGLLIMDRLGKMNPALAKLKVRQAINHAIDRDALLKAVTKGNGTVTGQTVPKTSQAYDPALDTRYPYDKDKAKQLLSEAGYAGGLTITMPEIIISGTTVYDLIKQYLGDAGITVKYEQVALNDAVAAVLAPKYAMAWFQLQQDPTAWQIANFTMTKNATFNPFKVDDPKVAAFAAKIQTGSEAEAAAAAKDLNKYVVEQAWFAPFYRVAGNFAADKKTAVTQQSDNAYPYLWNITPKA